MDRQQVGYRGSTRKRGAIEVKGGDAEKGVKVVGVSGVKIGVQEKGVKSLGGSYMKKKMGLQGGGDGYDGYSAVLERGGSSTMDSYFPKKQMGSSLLKGNCIYNLQASCYNNLLHA